MTFNSATRVLFVVMDSFGNIPLFASALGKVSAARHRKIIMRDLLVAFVLLTACLFFGARFMSLFQISAGSLRIAGGIILFLIAIKMVFGSSQELFSDEFDGEPLVVPLAVPYVAGPSTVSAVLLLAAQYPDRRPEWLLALLVASLANAAVLLQTTRLSRLLGRRGLSALERLSGLMLTAIAVEMFVGGLHLGGIIN